MLLCFSKASIKRRPYPHGPERETINKPIDISLPFRRDVVLYSGGAVAAGTTIGFGQLVGFSKFDFRDGEDN